MSEQPLKPCPFCGGKAITYSLSPYVGCGNCHADLCGYETEEQAITAWNTRSSSELVLPTDEEITKEALRNAEEQYGTPDPDNLKERIAYHNFMVCAHWLRSELKGG